MKVWRIEESFGLENLSLSEVATPTPKTGEILLKMQAISLNYRDMVTVAGGYGKTVKTPLVPCSDGVGTVIETGSSTGTFEKGVRLSPIFFPKWKDGLASPSVLPEALGGAYDGALCEYMIVDEDACVRVPDHLSDVQAASLPCAALTAWSALFEQSHTSENDRIVIQGTGGVALFALLFAKAVGAEVLITSSSDQKLERCKKLGADHCVNYYTQPNWGHEVKKVWSDGADHIIELGGAQTLEQSIRSVRIGGQISLIGVLTGTNSGNLPLPLILMRNVRIQGISVGSKAAFERMNAFIDTHKIEPVIDRIFNFQDTQKAFRYLESGQHFGKVCIGL